ncbi:hypothetical protein NL676_008566 [Syzygium grande]|nr:hypothetical protein NL676_008566 [Syzygium grande]
MRTAVAASWLCSVLRSVCKTRTWAMAVSNERWFSRYSAGWQFTARLGLQDLAKTLKWSCWRWRRLEHYKGVAVLQRLRARRNCFVVDAGTRGTGPLRPLVWPRGRWWRWLKHAVAGRH